LSPVALFLTIKLINPWLKLSPFISILQGFICPYGRDKIPEVLIPISLPVFIEYGRGQNTGKNLVIAITLFPPLPKVQRLQPEE
jgi:hypothetical protein